MNKRLKRVCNSCGKVFYCYGECKIKVRISCIDFCYCPRCFHESGFHKAIFLPISPKCPSRMNIKQNFVFR